MLVVKIRLVLAPMKWTDLVSVSRRLYNAKNMLEIFHTHVVKKKL